MKNALTPAGIEPATFRIVAQHLNHCATAIPSNVKGRYEEKLSSVGNEDTERGKRVDSLKTMPATRTPLNLYVRLPVTRRYTP